MSEGLRRTFTVERTDERPGHVDVSLVLVTDQEITRHLRRHRDVVERTVLFHRTFRPMVELAAMESYANTIAERDSAGHELAEILAPHARSDQDGPA